MAKPSDNMKGIHAAIVTADSEIAEIEQQRKACNDEMAAIKEKLERVGISRHAIMHCRRYMKMDENERRALDTAYAICREALGDPVQNDLLDLIKPIPTKEEKAEARRKAKEAAEETGDTKH
jgi:uncharacterized protein (UPF0335 family)